MPVHPLRWLGERSGRRAVGTEGNTVLMAMKGAGRVGWKFHRALTDEELAAVKARIDAEGGAAGFRAMWDVLLTEADGVSYEQAVLAGVRVEPAAYAIPLAQAELLTGWMQKARRGRGGASASRWHQQVTWTWFQLGPASFDPPSSPAEQR